MDPLCKGPFHGSTRDVQVPSMVDGGVLQSFHKGFTV